MTEYVYGGFPKGRLDPRLAISLWEQGFCDAEIAAASGVHSETVAQWRRKSGLKPNIKRPSRERARVNTAERIAAINAEARAHGMSYGQWRGAGSGTNRRGY